MRKNNTKRAITTFCALAFFACSTGAIFALNPATTVNAFTSTKIEKVYIPEIKADNTILIKSQLNNEKETTIELENNTTAPEEKAEKVENIVPQVQEVAPEPAENFTDVNETVWATGNVNVRELNNTNCSVITTLHTGDTVTRIATGDQGWSKVLYNDRECYISSKYLSTTEVTVPEVVTPQPEAQQAPAQVDHIIELRLEGNISSSLVDYAYSYIDKLPANIRYAFVNAGWSICLTDTNLAQRFFAGQYSSVIGCTVYGDRTIYVKNSKYGISNAIIHEFGHFIDNYRGTVSSSEEFTSYYNSEKYSFIEVNKLDDNSTSSTIEFFAEIFNQAILYPNSCSSSAPNAYNFVMSQVNAM